MTLVVDNPILNDPFEEPKEWWDYQQGQPIRQQGRRPAGYYRRSRTVPGLGAVAQEEFVLLPIPNDLRARVRAWRSNGYPGATSVTRQLLDHWNDPGRERRLFFCQREAAETVIFLVEAREDLRQGIRVPADEPIDAESRAKGYGPLIRWALKMATGSGKTLVMGMLVAWSVLNKATNRQDRRFSDGVLVVCPNLTVKERLQVLDPRNEDNYYDKFDLVPASLRPLLDQGRYLITNWHAFLPQDEPLPGEVKRGYRKVVRRGKESDQAFCERVLKDLGPKGNLLVINDEAHHAYRPPPLEEQVQAGRKRKTPEDEEAKKAAEQATVWVGGLDRINKARTIHMCLDFSATPFYIKGSGREEGQPFPWIVYDFGLVDAIECGIVKVPVVPVDDNTGQPIPAYFALWKWVMENLPPGKKQTARRRADSDAVLVQAQDALVTLASRWHQMFKKFHDHGTPIPPAMIVVCDNTELAGTIYTHISSGKVFPELANTDGKEPTLHIDTKVLDEAEKWIEGKTQKEAAERLRQKVATVGKEGKPGERIHCVVSVGMLNEGWDAQNVTQILGLRAFTSQLLCEQVVGRGLRRMNYDDFTEPEYVDVYGVPFEVIPVKRGTTKVPLPTKPSITVKALPERAQLAIQFPRVEGYVTDVRHRIRCDVDKLPYLEVHPSRAPTEVMVKPAAGYRLGRPDLLGPGEAVIHDRKEFYKQRRLHAAVFEMASEITKRLKPGKEEAGARWVLFPQVLNLVWQYLEKKVFFVEAPREEVALEKYKREIVDRLGAAIEPDTESGEVPLLPVIERSRPVGSTKEVQFRTSRPCFGTQKSHISHVVADAPNWEHSVAFRFERLEWVTSFARNDHMDFIIPYEWQGQRLPYRPDYLVRLRRNDGTEMTAIVEVKGMEREQDRAKQVGSNRWVKAVNHHGGYGRWAYVVIRDPSKVEEVLSALR